MTLKMLNCPSHVYNYETLKLPTAIFVTLTNLNNFAPSQRSFPRTKYFWTFPLTNSSVLLCATRSTINILFVVKCQYLFISYIHTDAISPWCCKWDWDGWMGLDHRVGWGAKIDKSDTYNYVEGERQEFLLFLTDHWSLTTGHWPVWPTN